VDGQDKTIGDKTGIRMARYEKDMKDMTGHDRTGQDRTGQDRTGQDRTGQDRTGQDMPGQGRSVFTG
jgi:hypothetical protein